MGVWGTGINSNDTAADVVDVCRKIYPIVSPEEADQIILCEFRGIIEDNEDTDDLADFWYAYANWQWDHGVLPEKNQSVVLNMLDKQCGMDIWLEEANQSDIRKRKCALDKLKEKLMSKQPPIKIPRPKIDKPKHKPGTVIIIKTQEGFVGYDNTSWTIQDFSSPEWFDAKYLNLPQKPSKVYNAQGKYLALLCVGSEREPYSKYFPDLFHEHSVYSFYDYCKDVPPTMTDLEKCGFLPNFDISYLDFNNNIIESIDWTYTFETIDRFSSRDPLIAGFERLEAPDEVKRFQHLIGQKNYLNPCLGYFTLESAFVAFFEEKLRFSEVGIAIDNLLDCEKRNPKLISPADYNAKK